MKRLIRKELSQAAGFIYGYPEWLDLVLCTY
jgi:hypothetical protein